MKNKIAPSKKSIKISKIEESNNMILNSSFDFIV